MFDRVVGRRVSQTALPLRPSKLHGVANYYLLSARNFASSLISFPANLSYWRKCFSSSSFLLCFSGLGRAVRTPAASAPECYYPVLVIAWLLRSHADNLFGSRCMTKLLVLLLSAAQGRANKSPSFRAFIYSSLLFLTAVALCIKSSWEIVAGHIPRTWRHASFGMVGFITSLRHPFRLPLSVRGSANQ